MKKLKLTQEGLEKLTRGLESKKEELRELGKYKGQAATNEGDASSEYVSINSPIGECIIGKRVGYEGKYIVNGNEIFVKIKSVSN